MTRRNLTVTPLAVAGLFLLGGVAALAREPETGDEPGRRRRPSTNLAVARRLR